MNQSPQNPKISIIIPSLNQGRYLRQAIESVLEQEYPNLELLVIDGKSEDESISIIKKYESNIDFWVSEIDEGQSDAINKGFTRSNGDLVAWLNADDYYLPGAFEAISKAYSSNSNAPFYFGDGFRVDKTGQIIAKFFPCDKLSFDRQALIMGLNYILQPSTFINRRYLDKADYLNTDLHYGMDSDLWMRLTKVESPMPIHLPLSASREYETTKTSTGSFERVEELRKISADYSGFSITPGVMCYFLDTLYRFSQEHEDIFTKDYKDDIISFWEKTSRLLEKYNARPDGFPKET